MDIEEKIEIATDLQEFHYIFRCFWDLVSIDFTEDAEYCSTAMVKFDNDGSCLGLIINKTFWDECNWMSQRFVICHECFHVLLEHSKRFLEYQGKMPESKYINIAADVVINEMLVKSFGFQREEMHETIQKGCWLNTVFSGVKVSPDESTEYYFNRLKKLCDKSEQFKQKCEEMDSFDKHEIAENDQQQEDLEDELESSGFYQNVDSDLLDKIKGSKESDNLAKKSDHKRVAGVGGGSFVKIKKNKVKVKKKWENVIKKWTLKYRDTDRTQTERWDRIKPAYTELLSDGKLSLPTNNWMLEDMMKSNRIEVYFFLDISGSCFEYKDRFYNAARTLNPKKFKVRLFSFDTSVKELDIKNNNIYGGGGTYFHILEDKIQDVMINENVSYPHAVWVITDGWANNFNPKHPERWCWFLTPDNTKVHIPFKSRIYELKDFE